MVRQYGPANQLIETISMQTSRESNFLVNETRVADSKEAKLSANEEQITSLKVEKELLVGRPALRYDEKACSKLRLKCHAAKHHFYLPYRMHRQCIANSLETKRRYERKPFFQQRQNQFIKTD